MDIPQMHFEFKDWKEAFSTWKKNLPLYGDKMVFVISTHWASSGYWIEAPGKEKRNKVDYFYKGDEVKDLELRVVSTLFFAALRGKQHTGLIL